MSTSTLPVTGTDLDPLAELARTLLAEDKGLLAIDESVPTCNRRFARLGIEQDAATRRDYRELILTTPGLADCISGVILCDETIRQHTGGGRALLSVVAQARLIPGIKVDVGAQPMTGHPGEKVTEGLDGLAERLAGYARMGARFAKWRAVFTIGGSTPSDRCIQANAYALARYAALCQQAGLLPVVEPEVLMAGDHSLARCGQVTEDVLRAVFAELQRQGVALEAMLLKPNMVLPGSDCPTQDPVEAVAAATVDRLRRAVPAVVAGIAFLSGGQSGDLARTRLAAMNDPALAPLPWPLAFSFGRAIQQPALSIWGGQAANAHRAQHALLWRAAGCRDARRGRDKPRDAIVAGDSAPTADVTVLLNRAQRPFDDGRV